MPKNELLKRIDETVGNSTLFDVDVRDPNEDTTPPVPEGVRVQAVQDGILVEVDFNVDTAHLHPRFQSFIVYAKPVSSEATDNSGQEVGRFSDSDWTWQPTRGGYTGWLIALSAISNTGYESNKTSWYYCVISTFHDDFSDYGGDTVSDLESLWWLKIVDFDSDETWTVNPGASIAAETSNYKEGDQGVKGTANAAPGSIVQLQYTPSPSLDLSVDGRFTDNDYVVIPVWIVTAAGGRTVEVRFVTTGSDYYGYTFNSANGLVGGWNYLKIKKSDFSATGSPSWANIVNLYIRHGSGGGDIVIGDDWRIVKADPDDSTTFNDTGRAWNFYAGTWHIYPGNRTGEPDYNYSLGQIKSGASDDFFATANNVDVAHGRVSAGIMLKLSDGEAGVVFRVEDATSGSEDLFYAAINTATDTLSLYRYSAGTKGTAIATASYTAAPGDMIWIGADFRDPDNEQRIKVYASANPWDLFTASTMKISHTTTEPWPEGNGVGLGAGDCNTRFVEFHAGSPQVANFAYKAAVALKALTAASGYFSHDTLIGLGDDDHPQYAALAQDELISGSWQFQSNVSACTGVTFDGVDLSVHAAACDAHHIPFIGLHDDDGDAASPGAINYIKLAASDSSIQTNTSGSVVNFWVTSPSHTAFVGLHDDDGDLANPGTASVVKIASSDGSIQTNTSGSVINLWVTTGSGTVGAHSLLNGGTHSDTAACTVTRGSIIRANSTPVWSELPIGAASYVLKSDGTDPGWAQIWHTSLQGLSVDDHSQYALLAGRSGSQRLYGGTSASNDLYLDSTPNATKGHVLIAASGGNVGINTACPVATLQVQGNTVLSGCVGINTTYLTNALNVNGNLITSDQIRVGSYTADTGLGVGLNIYQNSGIAPVLAVQSAYVSHGMTSLADTTTFFLVGIYDNVDNSGNRGGALLTGLSETNSPGLVLYGANASPDTNKSTIATGVVSIVSGEKTGTSSGSVRANGNLLTISHANVDVSGSTRFIFDSDGDFHADAGVSASGFDTYNDVMLTRVLEKTLSPRTVDSEFDRYITYRREDLEKMGILSVDEYGNNFVNVTRLQRLHNGALWQSYCRIQALESKVDELKRVIEHAGLLPGASPALLG